MPQYILTKNGQVNTIIAEESYIESIRSDYDSIELVEHVPASGAAASPPPIVYPTVSPIEFKLLFTAPERIAINIARNNDPIIEDFFSILEDQRLSSVNLNLQSVKDGLDYLIGENLITEVRKNEILSGNIK